MDPYSSSYMIPNNSLHNPVPHSLLRTRQKTHTNSFFHLLQRPDQRLRQSRLELHSYCAARGRMGARNGFLGFSKQAYQSFVVVLGDEGLGLRVRVYGLGFGV